MWTTIMILIIVVVTGLWLPTVCFAVVRLGIREYFKQKRIYLLEMLNEHVEPEDIKEHK